MAHLFTTDSVLLVIELKHSVGDTRDVILVIQRRVRAAVDAATHGEVDVLEAERTAAGVRFAGVAVFAGVKEEEEGNNGEVDDVGVELPPCGVEGVESNPCRMVRLQG